MDLAPKLIHTNLFSLLYLQVLNPNIQLLNYFTNYRLINYSIRLKHCLIHLMNYLKHF